MTSPYTALIPELKVSDYTQSLTFYTALLGFGVVYDRPAEKFAMLDREGAKIMIEAVDSTSRSWLTAPLERPYGRGINLQIEVKNIAVLYEKVKASGQTIYLDLEEKWYHRADDETGNRQFALQDPDGYLLRFFEDVGTRHTSNIGCNSVQARHH